MRSILHDSSLTAQWVALVKEAQSKILINLEEELEHYLVLLLIQFMTKPEMINKTIALDFLSYYAEPGEASSPHGRAQLKAIGDYCLLLSGLFPGRTQRRGLQLSYFINLGRIAYHNLGKVDPLYDRLSLKFTALLDILFTLRAYHQGTPIDLSQAIDLMRNTHSYYAYQLLQLTLKKRPH